ARGIPFLFAVDTETNEVVGWCDVQQMDAVTGYLGIGLLRAYRARGLGRRLLCAVLDKAQVFGYTSVKLEVRADNRRALLLYRALGFQTVKRREKALVLDGIAEDVLVMTLALPPLSLKPQEHTVYVDAQSLCNASAHGPTGIIISTAEGLPCKTVYAGSTIFSMPRSDKERIYALLDTDFDLRFIFDDALPTPEFYPVPHLMLFATDSLGGYFGTTESGMDIDEENAPIYYIDRTYACFFLAENLRELLRIVVYCPRWRTVLGTEESTALSISLCAGEEVIHALGLEKIAFLRGNEQRKHPAVMLYSSYREAQKMLCFYEVQRGR
ncbi:MAG: N-acetyltransferase, partial [Pygmaiobacter sp.]